MGKHRKKSFVDNINIGDLLKNLDINQIISLLSSFVGANNMTTDQLSSMLRNFDLNDISKGNNSSSVDLDKLRAQLSAIADRLDDVEKGQSRNVQDELINAIKHIQHSPEDKDDLMGFLKSSLGSDDDKGDRKDKRSKK